MTKFLTHRAPIIQEVAGNRAAKKRRNAKMNELLEFAGSIMCDETLVQEEFHGRVSGLAKLQEEPPLPTLPVSYDFSLRYTISCIDAAFKVNNTVKFPTVTMRRMPVRQEMIPVPEAMLE